MEEKGDRLLFLLGMPPNRNHPASKEKVACPFFLKRCFFRYDFKSYPRDKV
ncbi:MAG: hypothetical protein JSV96_19185 [Candidatus Aminicenantes bacterium]|nr:MAG: hypothetical protein JSV96_19185 [Candidatus Aminicenantes bacterium]